MLSCIYEGIVEHRRLSPVEHRFRYRLYMLYLDLDELPSVLQGGLGLHAERFSAASFCRKDHLGHDGVPLREAVLGLIAKKTRLVPAGPVRLLTLLRNFGYYFSPLNLYFCFEGNGQTVAAVVAEVSNTPWLEKHWYVLWEGNRFGPADRLWFRHTKSFHVSPFMGMNIEYEWRLKEPGTRLAVYIANLQEDRSLFHVSMALKRRELIPGAMARTLLRHPCMTARVSRAIYWQAVRLWLKKSPFYAYPENRSGAQDRLR